MNNILCGVSAKYTITLKSLLEDEKAKELIDKALSSYPILKPKNSFEYMVIPNREELNTKLLNHYKYREIGFETPARFIDELEISMNEIMPYYNQLFKTADIINGIDDVFGNVDITESFEEETTGKSSGLSSGTSDSEATTESTSSTESDVSSHNKNVNSATPQDQLSISSQNIDSVEYADNATWSEDLSHSNGTSSENGTSTSSNNSSSESSSESEGTTKHTLTRKGNQGVNTYAHDMLEFRELIRNIEQEIITNPRISELFMRVW